MTYTAWSADGRVIAFDDLPPAHRIYDDETETAAPSLAAGGVEHSAAVPSAGSAPTIHGSLPVETRGASKSASPTFSQRVFP